MAELLYFAAIPPGPVEPTADRRQLAALVSIEASAHPHGVAVAETVVHVRALGGAQVERVGEFGGGFAGPQTAPDQASFAMSGWVVSRRDLFVHLAVGAVGAAYGPTLVAQVWMVDLAGQLLASTDIWMAPPSFVGAPPGPETGAVGTARPAADAGVPVPDASPWAPPVWSQQTPAEPPMPPGRDPVVNTGFALPQTPSEPLSTDKALASRGNYLFWLDIGRPLAESIEGAAASLPGNPPARAMLTVSLFQVPDGLQVDPSRAVGGLTLRSDGTAYVTYQPSLVDGEVPPDRLFFPVTAPDRTGKARLWCHIYWRQVLLQTRLIEAEVASSSIFVPQALTSTVDYRIADPYDIVASKQHPEHAASVAIGTHALQVLATDGSNLLRAEATIGEGQLGDQIAQARGALSRVAWGSDEPWRPDMPYRYEHQPSVEQITADLILLAVNGYRLHQLLLGSLNAERVGNALRRPGFVQIALTQAAQHVVPAAMLYDLPLDTNARGLRLCPDFLEVAQKGEVFGSQCLIGECGQARDPDPEVVCPGGFWGFRHALGIPLSVGAAPAVPLTMWYDGGVRLAGGVYRDFPSTAAHVEALRGMLPWRDYQLGDDRTSTLRALAAGEPQIVYFYCHGGVDGSVPYVKVGGAEEQAITPDDLRQRIVRWPVSRPLVFLNGCRTSDLTPERAVDFVSFFVEQAWASGVIGTEITVFEPLATAFAQECLRAFLVDGAPIGAAVTKARISLLAAGNPLGLGYIPFVLPAIRREKSWFGGPGAP